MFHSGNPLRWDGQPFWSGQPSRQQVAIRKGDKEAAREEDWNVKMMGWGVQRCPCCDGTVSGALVQRVSQPAGSCSRLRGQGGSCVIQKESMYCTCTKKQQMCLSLHLCAFARTRRTEGRGRGLILIISCQALGLALQTRWCKSKRVSELCVCVCVRALQRCLWGRKRRISARFGRLRYFWLSHKGILNTRAHANSHQRTKSETFQYRHLHKSSNLAQYTLLFDSHARIMMHNS